ncbi:hypothetical protein GXN76_11040 [Kroppenstedtia pulmonis]|uniref:Uncharacterized protein n=1 Tax=Kroppenstedtia pulmonis TaxID=1380685 RepID=A0A7D3XNI0_9BACL|nr:hypothetical protein [Kroppenstedtia pulmonis]QKG84949.1 hypothetical protein GXN76_11040 [Kroppenstedtia pulmonis]
MSKRRSNESQLRHVIRQIIQEELAYIREEGPMHPEGIPLPPNFQGPEARPHDRDRSRHQPGPPPSAVFGSPQPAPDSSHRPPMQRHWREGPYEPDFDMDPPPYIPRNRNRE